MGKSSLTFRYPRRVFYQLSVLWWNKWQRTAKLSWFLCTHVHCSWLVARNNCTFTVWSAQDG